MTFKNELKKLFQRKKHHDSCHDINSQIEDLFSKYINEERFSEKKVEFNGINYLIPDITSFIYQVKDIYGDKVYDFECKSDKPIIIDCGANVGSSVIYFAHMFPSASIFAFEADLNIYEYLVKNINANIDNGCNITHYNKAIWIDETELIFYSEGADGGSLNSNHGKEQKVHTVALSNFLDEFEYVDFLKIDIEGAEVEVLPSCSSQLSKVDKLFVEYHSFIDKKQQLDSILKTLTQSGFKYNIKTRSWSDNYYKCTTCNNLFDLQIDIFAYKP